MERTQFVHESTEGAAAGAAVQPQYHRIAGSIVLRHREPKLQTVGTRATKQYLIDLPVVEIVVGGGLEVAGIVLEIQLEIDAGKIVDAIFTRSGECADEERRNQGDRQVSLHFAVQLQQLVNYGVASAHSSALGWRQVTYTDGLRLIACLLASSAASLPGCGFSFGAPMSVFLMSSC